MGIAQKIKNRTKKNLLDRAIKSKNRAKQFLGRGQMTKIRIKLYFFFFFFLTSNFFSLFGGDHGPLWSPSPSVIDHIQKREQIVMV
jgi:hypothetical protein